MRWMPRLRVLLARRPWIYWTVVVVTAGTVALATASLANDARRERDRWGTSASVWIATGDLTRGDLLAGAVSPRTFPVAMVPPDAITGFDQNARALQHISFGEVLVDTDVVEPDRPLALLPDGWLAVSVDGAGGELFAIGDSAAVLGDGEVIAAAAIIVRTGDDSVVVGVPADVAAHVADAANRRAAVVALSANPSQ